MRFEDWPEPDQKAWEAACRQATPLSVPGGAVRWAAATRQITVVAWGRFLTYLAVSGELDPAENPAKRLTRDRCGAFIASLSGRLAPITVDAAVIFLGKAISVLAPGEDWSWVGRHPLRPRHKEIRVARRPRPVPDPVALLLAAVDLCDEVDVMAPTARQAGQFRDGVLVVFAVYVAVRRRNITETRIDVNLFLGGQGGRLVYPTTKVGEPFDVVLSPLLADLLTLYVERHRPVLLSMLGKDTDRLWISVQGRPMEASTIYNTFRKTALALIGMACSIHSVRHALVTTMMKADPRDLDIAAAALGHRSSRTTRGAYDQSGASASNGVWQDLIEQIRREPLPRSTDSDDEKEPQ